MTSRLEQLCGIYMYLWDNQSEIKTLHHVRLPKTNEKKTQSDIWLRVRSLRCHTNNSRLITPSEFVHSLKIASAVITWCKVSLQFIIFNDNIIRLINSIDTNIFHFLLKEYWSWFKDFARLQHSLESLPGLRATCLPRFSIAKMKKLDILRLCRR